MIQYPTNVKPSNYAFDATQQTGQSVIEYTFNGDILTHVIYQIFNYETYELAYEVAYEREAYAGYKVSHSIPANTLTNGRKYVMQMILCQNNKTSGSPIADMPVLSGTIEDSVSTGSTNIYIEPNITSIYPAHFANGIYSRTAFFHEAMVLKINGESRLITSYEPEVSTGGRKLGKITISAAFSSQISAESHYEIYSNFVLSPQYYFECQPTPSMSFEVNFYNNRCSVEGTYSSSTNPTAVVENPIKYYTLKWYWSNSQYFPLNKETTGEMTKLIAETEKIYSQQVSFDFFYPYYHDDKYTHGTSDYYKVVCEVVTQKNMTVKFESDVIEKEPDLTYETPSNCSWWNSYELEWDDEKGRVIHKLNGYGSSGNIPGQYILFRTDLDTGEEISLFPHHFGRRGSALCGYDMTASTHGRYMYKLIKFTDEGRVIIPKSNDKSESDGMFPNNTIEISGTGYYITELNVKQSMDSIYHPNQKTNRKTVMETGETWKFTIDIADTTVTNNLDRMTHVGYGKYVSSTSTNVNYMSGTLSAMLGDIDCEKKEYVDNIAIVNAWRKFITQLKPFMLKSQKGDVWVVNITDNPTTQYQESYYGIPTTFTFSWAESYSIKDIDLWEEIS